MITLWLHYYINTVDIFEKITLKSEFGVGKFVSVGISFEVVVVRGHRTAR